MFPTHIVRQAPGTSRQHLTRIRELLIPRMARSSAPRAEQFLPLSQTTFYILLALADGAQHGYAIMRAVRNREGGGIRLGSGTLYRAISSLLSSGLVEEVTPERPSYDDARRRYYGLTKLGHDVLVAETQRMANAVSLARARRIVIKTV